MNLRSGVRLQGYNAQKATFSQRINVKQIGHAILTVPEPDGTTDSYLITLPSLHIENLIFGAPYVELDGSSYITSSTGFTAHINYSGRGWLSGKKCSFSATLCRTEAEKDVLFSASGQWNDVIHFNESRHGPLDTLDLTNEVSKPLTVAPLELQHPLESRRAWAKLAAAVVRGDMDAVGIEKGKIERAQRDARARERADSSPWVRRYFSPCLSDKVLETLGCHVGVPANGDADKTGGLWRFDEAKAGAVAASPPLTAEEVKDLETNLLGQ